MAAPTFIDFVNISQSCEQFFSILLFDDKNLGDLNKIYYDWQKVYEKQVFAGIRFSLVMTLMVFLCCPFPHEMSWMRSETLLNQFLRVFLPTFENHSSRYG